MTPVEDGRLAFSEGGTGGGKIIGNGEMNGWSFDIRVFCLEASVNKKQRKTRTIGFYLLVVVHWPYLWIVSLLFHRLFLSRVHLIYTQTHTHEWGKNTCFGKSHSWWIQQRIQQLIRINGQIGHVLVVTVVKKNIIIEECAYCWTHTASSKQKKGGGMPTPTMSFMWLFYQSVVSFVLVVFVVVQLATCVNATILPRYYSPIWEVFWAYGNNSGGGVFSPGKCRE